VCQIKQQTDSECLERKVEERMKYLFYAGHIP
jgi:hypothetical protein